MLELYFGIFICGLIGSFFCISTGNVNGGKFFGYLFGSAVGTGIASLFFKIEPGDMVIQTIAIFIGFCVFDFFSNLNQNKR